MIRISDVEFDRTVRQALREIPAEFQRHLENVVVEVRGRPDRAFMREHDVPDDLLGLYVGDPLEELGGVHVSGQLPARIYIFRDNLCEMCEDRDELLEEIKITVLHEVGHHFGLDEDRLEELGFE